MPKFDTAAISAMGQDSVSSVAEVAGACTLQGYVVNERRCE